MPQAMTESEKETVCVCVSVWELLKYVHMSLPVMLK